MDRARRHPDRHRARAGSARRAVAWGVLAAFSLFPPGLPAAWAGPSGHEVVAGKVDVRQEGKVTVIETGSDTSIVDWTP